MLRRDAEPLLGAGLPVGPFGSQLQSLTPIHTGYGNTTQGFCLAMLYIPIYMKTSAAETKYHSSQLKQSERFSI